MASSLIDNITMCYRILTFRRRIKSRLPLLALLGAHHILHVLRIRVKLRLFRKSQKIKRNTNNIDNQLDAKITAY